MISCYPLAFAEAIVSILRNHMDDPEIARSAINALGRMAISAENMNRIAQVHQADLGAAALVASV